MSGHSSLTLGSTEGHEVGYDVHRTHAPRTRDTMTTLATRVAARAVHRFLGMRGFTDRPWARAPARRSRSLASGASSGPSWPAGAGSRCAVDFLALAMAQPPLSPPRSTVIHEAVSVSSSSLAQR